MGQRVTCVAAATLVALCVGPTSAEAICGATVEAGTWVNVDLASDTIVRLEIERVCKDEIGSDAIGSAGWYRAGGPNWYVEPIGSCDGSECSWGRAGGEVMNRSYRPVLGSRRPIAEGATDLRDVRAD